MAEFTVGDHSYATTRDLNPFVINNVLKRLAPAMAGVVALLGSETPAPESDDFRKSAGALFMSNIGPITKTIAEMPDTDSDFILTTCLGVVSRRTNDGKTLAPILAAGPQLMFKDITIPDMYMIVYEVLKEHLGPFFASLGRLTSQGAPAP